MKDPTIHPECTTTIGELLAHLVRAVADKPEIAKLPIQVSYELHGVSGIGETRHAPNAVSIEFAPLESGMEFLRAICDDDTISVFME